jgi:hypothetical protein
MAQACENPGAAGKRDAAQAKCVAQSKQPNRLARFLSADAHAAIWPRYLSIAGGVLTLERLSNHACNGPPIGPWALPFSSLTSSRRWDVRTKTKLACSVLRRSPET